MADNTDKLADLQAKELQHKIVQLQNAKLERLLKQHQAALKQKETRERAKARKKRLEQQRQNGKTSNLAWKQKRYKERMDARRRANQNLQRSPRYRPANSNYMPSSKSGVPLTGSKTSELTRGNRIVTYSNFSREKRFLWQNSKDQNPGPCDYNPNLGNAMEQFVYVDFVQPYAYNDKREAKREQDLKPGILRIQDRQDNVVSERKRLLDTSTKYTDLRKAHSSYGKNPELRREIRNGALKNVHHQDRGVKKLLVLENGEAQVNTETHPSTGSENKTVQSLRRQLEHVHHRLKRIENERSAVIRKFQVTIERLKISSLNQEQEMRSVTQKLEDHRNTLQSLRETSADLVGTLLDVSPLFSNGAMKQPFTIIQSKALQMHHAVEHTSETLFSESRVKHGTSTDDALRFADHIRQHKADSEARQLNRKLSYRQALSPPSQNETEANMKLDADAGRNHELVDDHFPPAPPPSVPPTTTNVPNDSFLSLSDKNKVDFLFQWGVNHRSQNESSGSTILAGSDGGTIGLTEYVRIFRDANALDNNFGLNDALLVFAKHALGSSSSKQRIGLKGVQQNMAISNSGFHNSLIAVATLKFPGINDASERKKKLFASFLVPLAKYYRQSGGQSHMSSEQERNVNSIITQAFVSSVGKHLALLQGIFAQAAGFNQTPPHSSATWLHVKKKGWCMSVDQILEYLKSVGLTPQYIRGPDLGKAVVCATAGNYVFRGATIDELSFPQFVEVLGYLALDCFSPDRHASLQQLQLPEHRLDFLCSHFR